MKKLNRVTSNDDFASIIHSTKPIRTECFLVYSKINELNFGRVGISVSKKVGKAVTRNKIRRQIRAIFDSLVDYQKSNRDYVVVVRSPYLNYSFKDIKVMFERTLERLGKK